MFENRIKYADEMGNEFRAQGKTGDDVWAAIQSRITDEYPVFLGMVRGVTYDSKNDRYIAQVGEKNSAKVTNDVATFLLQHAAPRGTLGTPMPTVYARMKDGVVEGVLLLFSYRP